jgi:superfamily I DNA/RNA helicase
MLNLASLNPAQREAVTTIDGPVLILAGAGTGKTRVITFRVAHMIEKGVAPGNILAVTFTNKAAREMRERIDAMVPKRRAAEGEEKPERPTISTFHSLCVRILRQHIEKLGYKRNFVIYSESEQLGAIKKILSHLSAKADKIEPGKLLALLSRFKNAGARSGAALQDPENAAVASWIMPRYESALRACNAVDFDDLILLTLKLFQEHPDALEMCRRKYRYVMVDEYQDTNAAQFKLVHFLTKEHKNLCVVGDDDQSIYGWRGAEIANLLNLERYYPTVKIVKLEQNYRSTNTILNAANAVIKNNAMRRGKKLWSKNGEGAKIQICAYENDENEARSTAEQINYARVSRGIPWGDQAVLFRTNQQARAIETAMRQAGIRYHLIGGQSYFDRREIKDALAYFRVFINPDDDISLLRIANVPARGLSDVTMERLIEASQKRQCSVFGAMRRKDVLDSFATQARQSIIDFAQLVEDNRALIKSGQSMSLQTWAQSFLEKVGYIAEVRRLEKNPEMAEIRLRNLKDLLTDIDEAGTFSPRPAERLNDFLEDLTLDSDRSEDKDAPADSVTLITMHSCKGLEFPHVYIVGLEDGLLPHSRSKVEGTLDEERRLFYVSITRAKETLTISHCGFRKKYGQPITCQPSPFLRELPSELVEKSDEKSKAPVSAKKGKSFFDAMRAAVDEQ